MEVSQDGVPQWRCCFDDQCEAKFESFRGSRDACAASPQTNGDGVQTCNHESVSCVVWRCMGIEKRLIVIFCLLFVVGPVVIDLVTLGQVHIPQSLCCPVCSAEPGNWSELQSHLAEHLSGVVQWISKCRLGGNASRKRLRKARVGER